MATYGRFSSHPSASSVMHRAKKIGATKRIYERFQEQQEELRKEQEEASRAGFWASLGGNLGKMAGMKFLVPLALSLVPGVGIGAAATALKTIIGAGVQQGAGNIGDALFRQWAGAGKKGIGDISEFGDVGGIYSQDLQSRLKSDIGGTHKTLQSQYNQALDAEKRNQWISSLLVGGLTAGKATDALSSKLGELDKMEELAKSQGVSTELIESMKANPNITLGDIAEGDWREGWKSAFGETKKNIGNLSMPSLPSMPSMPKVNLDSIIEQLTPGIKKIAPKKNPVDELMDMIDKLTRGKERM